MALAVFKQFLHYASEVKRWISAEDAQAALVEAWAQLLPGSAPQTGAVAAHAAGSWNEPAIFWSFMGRYLQERQQHISLSGAPCKLDTIAVTHELPAGKYFILPRDQFAQAYADGLRQRGASLPEDMEKWPVTLQRTILDWGVQVKTEGNGTTWRYTFYDKKVCAEGAKLPCLAFPLVQLPESITNSLSDWFGSAFEPWISPQSPRSTVEAEIVAESNGSRNNV